MRKLSAFVLLLVAAVSCTTMPPPEIAPSEPAGPYGLTVQEEATILALEDRREYNPDVVSTWVSHPNPLHRVRIALALGRIGPHTFVDTNSNGEKDSDERQAGVTELIAMAGDPDRRVREMVAFAMGEIGELSTSEPLFSLAIDADGGVGTEAVEALSKLAEKPGFTEDASRRYVWMTDERWPEGVRARATRYLFRLERDIALAAAVKALASPSSAIRQEAAYSLSRKPSSAATRQLELLLTDPNVLTRAYSVAALGRNGDPTSAQAVIEALGDVHPWVRTNAAVALSRIAEKDDSIVREAELPRIFAAMDDPDPGVRAAIIDAMGSYAKKYEMAKERLLRVLRDGTAAERELARSVVIRGMSDQDLGKTSLPTTPWALGRMMESHPSVFWWNYYHEHESPIVRAAIGTSIPDGLVDAAMDKVTALMSDPDVIVRATAIEKYSHSERQDPDLWLATLEKAEQRERTSELNDARLAAIHALAEFDRPERELFLRSLLTDSDPVVRRTAADLIVDKLGKDRPQYTPLPIRRTAADYEEIVRWSRETHSATIHMTRGTIELALLAQDAPMTAWNFAQLAKKKYFDNTSFMRVVPNFVIQGGDPRNDMNGGPGYSIRDEINLQRYTRGAVGMALSGPDTGGSQFFITHSPQPHLDGGYTIFARVADGMTSTVDQTERGDRVLTIAIDEHAPAAAAEKAATVPNVSLPLVIGAVTREQILAALPSYVQRSADYAPDVTVLEEMKTHVVAGDRVEVYMGTWCDDSEREVPKFLRVVDDLRSQFGVDLPTTFVAVDRSKTAPADLLEGKSVDKVPTFIYYRGATELGRIVERTVGPFEDQLLTIAAHP
jgi:cyclophilin family peptidyl-prolyl cis-trans isomerase/HEAT repeat protein